MENWEKRQLALINSWKLRQTPSQLCSESCYHRVMWLRGQYHVIRIAVLIIILTLTGPVFGEEMYEGKTIAAAEYDGWHIEYIPGEVIVRLRPGGKMTALDPIALSYNLDIDKSLESRGFYKIGITDKNTTTFDLMSELAKSDEIEYALPNILYRLQYLPDDPYFGLQWPLHNTGQDPPAGTFDADIDAPEAWNTTTGDAGVIIAILDSGIPIQNGALSHPELDDPQRIIIGPNYISGGLPVDDNGHGTHVAGIIAATGDNGIGIAGLAYSCSLMPIKVFTVNGFASLFDILDATYYAVDNGCRVINFSGGGPPNPAIEGAIAYADTNDVVFCAAAGNEHHGVVLYPGAYSTIYSNVICVSATDQNDESSEYSSIGPEVTVAAPGGKGRPFDGDDIYSTFPDYTVYLNSVEGLPQEYSYLAGTSMAAPHVSALVGLIRSALPAISADSVRAIIVNTTDDLGPAGFDTEYGFGRINAQNALLHIGDINIGHDPLPDTRDTIDDYRVNCAVYSIDPIGPGAVVLHYNAGNGWQIIPMQEMRLLVDYEAFIPAQAPGTIIDYFISAQNTSGAADTTEIYTFHVIDYRVSMSPAFAYAEATVGDTVWYPCTITNGGVYSDSYDLKAESILWPTTIWNENRTARIDQIESVPSDENRLFYIAVVIGASSNGEVDSTTITVLSKSKPDIAAEALCETRSLGQALSLPFSEQFTSPDIDQLKWTHAFGVTVDDAGLNIPSGPYALHFDGNPTGTDTIVSQIIDLSGEMPVNLIYSYQQTGNGESPDVGNDLVVEYVSSAGSWVELRRHAGADPDMSSFREVSTVLPADAYHDRFRMRIFNNADMGFLDDWFVDDISIEHSPQITVTLSESFSVSQPPDAITQAAMTISNTGASDLLYSIDILPDFSQSEPYLQAFSTGLVEPSSRIYPPEYSIALNEKGMGDDIVGCPILYNAGGPDNYGYIWIDSDDPSGPVFDWIDISQSGEQADGLLDDNYAGPYPIGFEFPFYGRGYTEFYISANGFIGFGPTEGYAMLANSPLPTFSEPNNLIALLWDDLNFTDPGNSSGAVYYQTIGDALVIQFSNVPEYGASFGDVFNGEIILHEDGRIFLQYLGIAPGFVTDECTVGIEGPAGLDGLEIAYNTAYLSDNLAIGISPSKVPWLLVSQPSGVVNPGHHADVLFTFTSTNMSVGTYGAAITLACNDPDNADAQQEFGAFLNVLPAYLAGDCNGDEEIDIGDALYIVNYLFMDGPAPQPLESGDNNCDDLTNIGDAVYIVSYLFKHGPAPCDQTDKE